ncbi:hypothetical protein [Pseudoalteromonas galatheae]|uniref:hypothetical protein n=1 Tax=Pseudoalteromonas galatheae TaxID=579562 RepID=UPI0030CCA020
MKQEKRNHYLLIKRKGYCSEGHKLTATESAKALLDAGYWPLFKQTPCKNLVEKGQKILIYLAGAEKDCQRVIASATIDSIVEWSNRVHKPRCPIMLDDIPSLVLNLKEIKVFEQPINIKDHLDKLDLVPSSNPQKWGAALVGGMKTLTMNDYSILSGGE